MPPMSLTVSVISVRSSVDLAPKTLLTTEDAENSIGNVLTSAPLSEVKILPAFSPTTPPTFVFLVTLPVT